MVGDQRSGPKQPGFDERLGRDQDTRAEDEPARCGIGLVRDGGTRAAVCAAGDPRCAFAGAGV